MRKTLVIVGILVLAAVASACRGAAGSAPTETSPEFRAAAQEAADSALLTLDDFPSGWTSAPPAADTDDSQLGLSKECSALELETFPGQVAEAESDDFTGPDEQEVSSAISVFPTDDTAQEAVDAFNNAFDQCGKELEDALTRLIKEGAEAGELPSEVELDLQVNVENLSFERFGDATVAYRIPVKASFIGITLEFTIDLVFMRDGRVAGGLFYFSLGEIDAEEEQQLAQAVADNLEQANASLPD